VSPPPPLLAQSGGAGKSYALLIGIGAYEQWPALVNPVPDVRAVAGELRNRYGFLPEVLENPKRAEILSTLRRYAGLEYGPQDQLLIVFAGHGTFDEVTQIGYLAARDSASRRRDPNFDTLIDYPRLVTLLDNIPCRRILLVVDACYSGTLGEASASSGAGGDGRGGSGKSRLFLTSGGKEYVPDGDPDRHTPFMRQLLAGLHAPGADRVLTVQELQRSFMSRIEPRPHWGRFGGDEGKGGVTFAVAAGAAPEASRGADAAAPAPPVPASPAPSASAPAPPPPLRPTPIAVVEQEIERSYRLLGLFDATWNPEGDFANELRSQRKGLWEVVADLESRLMWQKGGSPDRLNRADADGYVAQLNAARHAGYADWRLPTLEELASLLEPQRLANGLYLSPSFDPEQETCWSSDRDGSSGQPYYVSFNAGRAVLAYGERQAFVRAVRSNP
jgi:Protein of unknown function (DUF1566)/Caspase domain